MIKPAKKNDDKDRKMNIMQDGLKEFLKINEA